MYRFRLAALLFSLLGAAPAAAGSLRGTLIYPSARVTRAERRPLARWRVANGVLPIAAAQSDIARRDVVVVLEPARPAPPPPEGSDPPKVALEAKPLRLEPRVAIGRVGTIFTFHNGDRAPRSLYLKNGENYMAREATAPGGEREVKFTVAGEYEVLDVDNPRVSATLVVVASPYFAHADDHGAFSVEAPDGKYVVRAWYRGSWSAPQPVELGRTHEISIKLAPAPEAREGR
jgi:hypothetical protein